MCLCKYGCGNEAKFKVTSKKLDCCSDHYLKCPKSKEKNSLGLKKAYKNGLKSYFCNMPKHKRTWSKGKTIHTDPRLNKFKDEDIFCKDSKTSRSALKRRLFIERGKRCESCQLEKWLGKDISIELDHINGIKNDNRKENLKLLCPNCHAQTPTYRGKNKVKVIKIKPIYQKLIKPKLLPIRKPRPTKFFAEKEELESLIKTTPLTKIGKLFGVTDNAIKKRCRKLGIDLSLSLNHHKNPRKKAPVAQLEEATISNVVQ